MVEVGIGTLHAVHPPGGGGGGATRQGRSLDKTGGGSSDEFNTDVSFIGKRKKTEQEEGNNTRYQCKLA